MARGRQASHAPPSGEQLSLGHHGSGAPLDVSNVQLGQFIARGVVPLGAGVLYLSDQPAADKELKGKEYKTS